MMNPTTQRYRAFVSYSQHDRRHAKRLHSALESYRVPKGIEAPLPPDRRLGRFFRDDDEMGAANDLGGVLRGALEDSENLIVICSPHSARSKWVNAEVLHFKSLGRGRRIFAVIVDGTPNSGDTESDCFPPALRLASGGEELLSEQHAEPLGIDLRKEPFERARIRLVAGLLGVSFDSLWQRDRRRAAKRRAIAAAATLVLGGVIAALGVQWLRERGRVHAQTIDRALVRLRDDLASERVKPALAELGGLYDEGERESVESVLKTALSWVSTSAELLKEVKPPAFITNGAQLFFLAADGSRHPMNIHQPYRRILSSNKKRLLILGPEEAVVLDVASGRELSRAASNGIQWNGYAFETGSKLLVVAGRHNNGISNSSFRESFLVFSPSRQTLSVFDQHWNADGRRQYRFIQPLYVGSDCRSFGVTREDFPFEDEAATPDASDMLFLSANADGLKPTTAPDSLEGWETAAMFDAEERFEPEGRGNFNGDVSSAAGCVAPAADSKLLDTQPAETGPARPVGLGVFWESVRRWKVVGQSAGEPSPSSVSKGRPALGNPPCTEKRPCPVQDFGGEKVFQLSYNEDWTIVTPPRGVLKDDSSFDRVDKETVYVSHVQFNGGLQSSWCRNVNAKTVCLETGTGAELFDDQTDVELRSNTGRIIFYPHVAAEGFHLYDLSTMRDVTPRGPEIVVSTHHADFSPDDKRLFVTSNGRLLVFEPPTGGGAWQQASGAAAQLPALSGNTENKVAGLLALDDADLLVVRGNGAVSRFNWRTGQQTWARIVGGVGEVYSVVVSKNRRFVLVIGREGGRLLDTKDGLVLSGVLVPPPAMDRNVATGECFKEAFVSDAGAVNASCGEKEYRREQTIFDGDVRSRLKAILSDEL